MTFSRIYTIVQWVKEQIRGIVHITLAPKGAVAPGHVTQNMISLKLKIKHKIKEVYTHFPKRLWQSRICSFDVTVDTNTTRNAKRDQANHCLPNRDPWRRILFSGTLKMRIPDYHNFCSKCYFLSLIWSIIIFWVWCPLSLNRNSSSEMTRWQDLRVIWPAAFCPVRTRSFFLISRAHCSTVLPMMAIFFVVTHEWTDIHVQVAAENSNFQSVRSHQLASFHTLGLGSSFGAEQRLDEECINKSSLDDSLLCDKARRVGGWYGGGESKYRNKSSYLGGGGVTETAV